MPELFSLEYPQSLGVYDKYADAQKAVDYLSDNEFPVQNCLIVGTELRQVERVTGRLTWGRVLMGGAASGAWLGMLIGLLLSIFTDKSSFLATVAVGSETSGSLIQPARVNSIVGMRPSLGLAKRLISEHVVDHDPLQDQSREFLRGFHGRAGASTRNSSNRY